MYIRWKQRKKTFYCYLCKSERKNGKPVSTTLAYLGSSPITPSTEEGEKFLFNLEEKLQRYNFTDSRLGKLKNSVREKLGISQKDSSLNISTTISSIEYESERISKSELSQFESIESGIFLFNRHGQVSHFNEQSRHVLDQLSKIYGQSPEVILDEIRQSITTVFEELDTETFSGACCQPFQGFHLRLYKIEIPGQLEKMILLVTENWEKYVQAQASLDTIRYGLTPRESEVWMLKSLGLSYQAISQKLFITVNTVKKHIAHIHQKKDAEFIAS